MTASFYRPSGRRKGTHLNAAERTRRVKEMERIFRDKIDKLRISYLCPGEGDHRCAASLASIVYGGTRHITSRSGDLEIGYDVPLATLTCERGHVQEVALRS